MGFFNLYKPKEYNYRYIYYDPKKEAKKERDKETNGNEDGEYKRIIRRGTFREMAEKNKRARIEEMRKTNIRLIIIVLILLAFAYYILS
ncbi:MAG: hypothetical protein PHH37_06735 [Paludibacter sp.]|nr:hypothetical protein [Paludibacter sp.]